MSDTIPFKCPKCSCTTLKLKKKPENLEDFEGAVCSQCQHVLTVDDIKNQAAEIAKNAITEAFKNSKFK